MTIIAHCFLPCLTCGGGVDQDARRQEEKEYREHPDAADKGFIRGLEFLRERGVIGDFKVMFILPFSTHQQD